MHSVETLLGNADDPAWVARLADATVDLLVLDQWEAQRSRLRKSTEGGVELAISLDRSVHLRDGDILAWDEVTGTAIVARIDLKPVMIVYLDGLAGVDPAVASRTCVELGHAIGNQHWPAVVKGDRVYVPLTVDHNVMSSVMRTHAFEGIRYEFVPAAEVIPYLAPHEARRLFGAAEIPGTITTTTCDRPRSRGAQSSPSMPSPVAAAMRLLQFGDSMLPVGSFAFSNALESAVEQGVVHDVVTLRGFVRHGHPPGGDIATASPCCTRIGPPWPATSTRSWPRTTRCSSASSTRKRAP